jgi:sirohydrochlorin cobaltochelatase
MTHPDSTKGIILFAHGSRDPLWHKPMEAVAEHIRHSASDTVVGSAYLELSTPDLATAMQAQHQAGVRSVTVVPLFLGVGKHAREDLPVLVAGLRQQYPDVQIALAPAVSEDPRLIQILAEIALTS